MDEEKQLPATANPDNLYWIMSEAKFMYLPTRTLFDRNAVIRQIGGEKAQVIEETKVVSNLFWAPGMPTFLENVAVIDGELFEHAGNSLLNLYKGPNVRVDGDANDVDFWLELGRFVFGDDMDHLIKVLAFKIQHPDQKVNHAIVIGSFDQGIGKDAWISPTRRGVGYHNFGNTPAGLAVEWNKKGFNAPILQKVISRISEVHDLGADRFKFYDMTKDWAASPPETLRVSDKNVRPYQIQNVVLPIYSTNHKTDGMFWPPEDRRHFMAWSDRKRADFETDHWRTYWDFHSYDIPRDDVKKDEFWRGYWEHLKRGADYNVVAYLQQPHLIEGFNPGATPPHTAAWHEVAAANVNPQDNKLADLLDTMGPDADWLDEPIRPDAVTIEQITSARGCPSEIAEFFGDHKKARQWPHRLSVAVRLFDGAQS